MKPPLLFLACIGVLATAQAAAPDPFGGASPAWTDSVRTSKPLCLEICFGENPFKENSPPRVTPGFLASAKTLRIAVAVDDQGRVETPDGIIAVYRLKSNDQAHSLDLNFSLSGQNRREITSSVSLVLNEWAVLGGLTRTEVAVVKGKSVETRQNLVIGIRLVTSNSP